MKPLDNLERHCLNVLEDVRINEKLRTTYPGCRENLAGLYRSLNEKILDQQANPKPEDKPLPAYVKKIGSLHILLENLDTLGLPSDVFGKEFADFGAKHFPTFQPIVAGATTTTHLVQAAKDLATFVREDYDKEPPPPPQEGEDDGEGDGQPGNGPGSPFDPRAGMTESLPQQVARKDFCDKAKAARERQKADPYGRHTLHASQSDPSLIPDFKPWETLWRNQRGGYSKLADMMRTSAGLREQLRQAVLSIARARKTRDQLDGDLDMGKLATIASRISDPQVYHRTTPGRAVNTAIHCLVDQSGSMAPYMDLACAAAASLCEAAAACGASVKLTGFEDATEGAVWVNYGEKPTREQWLRRMEHCISAGGTPTGQHIHAAARDITARAESRKIIIVVTDGVPDCVDFAADMARVSRNAGVEVYAVGIISAAHRGIGIEDTFRKVYGPKAFVLIDNAAALRPVLLGMLTQIVLRREGR